MAQPQPESMQRSPEQVTAERAMGEVSDVLLNLEHTLERARKARKLVAKEGSQPNVELALGDAIKELERTRKRLMQDTYFAGDALRML